MQRPSSESAIKIVGKGDHECFRDGEEALTPERAVDCLSATYTRSLVRDLGAALGDVGHLTALRRTAVGNTS